MEPQAERINVPGTISLTNWSYRVPVYIEDLHDHAPLCTLLADLIQARRTQPLT